MNKPNVAVVGATGYTGRFVVTELLRRGFTPISIARNADQLESTDFGSPSVIRRQSRVDDAASLDRAFHDVRAVINCAGPFRDTAGPVIEAAIRANAHYVDVCAEQAVSQTVFDVYDEPARKARIAALTGLAMYGGLADLLVTDAMGEWDSADSIDIMVGLSSWYPTTGSRNTIAGKGDLAISGGRPVPVVQPGRRRWTFGEPLGEHTVIEVPFTEMVLIPRHVRCPEVHNYLSEIGVQQVLDPTTPLPEPADESGRSAQRFAVEAIVTRGDEQRSASVRGQDGYAASAPMVCEAVERLVSGDHRSLGALTPGEIFEAGSFLDAIGLDYSPAH